MNGQASFSLRGRNPDVLTCISIAMCLHAILTDDPVYYTQPQCYRPDYSYGIAQDEGHRKVWAYLLRRESFDYYQLPVR